PARPGIMEMKHSEQLQLESAPEYDKEKVGEDLEAIGEREGYLLDTNAARDQGWQTTSDGQIILIPQPSSSPLDPLHWSSLKKHVILVVISCTAFLPD